MFAPLQYFIINNDGEGIPPQPIPDSMIYENGDTMVFENGDIMLFDS